MQQKIRASPSTRRTRMNITPTPVPFITKEMFETAGKHLSILIAFIVAFFGFKKWLKGVLEKRRIKKGQLASIEACMCELKNSISDIKENQIAMNDARNLARQEDGKIRQNLYMGQIAVISAVRELAEHQGLKINGPVQYYYEQNIDALRTGLGMETIELKKGGN